MKQPHGLDRSLSSTTRKKTRGSHFAEISGSLVPSCDLFGFKIPYPSIESFVPRARGSVEMNIMCIQPLLRLPEP